ncbi:glycosyltransferase family 2 protein [Bacillus niameyensis]|uniref:glycosyltransferase family 2 protein n=1 Tax=Bacillus niameyensis TaxID=1522308 RepID=UPI00078620EF|nr:glycosyltransferase [Bacillus niameyensis]
MFKDNPKVSIIMGVYNCADTLSQSIESIIKQSFTDWEFIICDDASTDDTYKIASFYAEGYPGKIKLLRNESNKKLAATLNRCLSVASGQYIARQDGDDISLSNRLEKQVAFLDSNPEYMLVGTGMIPFDENGDMEARIGKTEPVKQDIPVNNTFMHATIMMRKEGYEELKGYRVMKQTRRAEDYDLWIRFFAAGFRGYNLQEALYKVKEDKEALKRRKLRYYFDTSQLIFIGCRTLKLPIKYYLFIFKPILIGMTPKQFVKKYYKYRDKKLIKNVHMN